MDLSVRLYSAQINWQHVFLSVCTVYCKASSQHARCVRRYDIPRMRRMYFVHVVVRCLLPYLPTVPSPCIYLLLRMNENQSIAFPVMIILLFLSFCSFWEVEMSFCCVRDGCTTHMDLLSILLFVCNAYVPSIHVVSCHVFAEQKAFFFRSILCAFAF